MTPYRKKADLPAKVSSDSNWIGPDGRFGINSLTAKAINSKKNGDLFCKKIMDYMISELKACLCRKYFSNRVQIFCSLFDEFVLNELIHSNYFRGE
jgi:hypothetical protein